MRVPDAIANVVRAMEVAGVRGLRHPDTHDICAAIGVRREFQCDLPPLPSFTTPPGNVFHCPSGARPERHRPDPIIDLVHLGVGICPADPDRVDRLLGAQVHHDPLRVQRVALTGELAGQVRIALPVAVVRALDRAVAAGREAAVGQGVAQDVAQRLLEFAAAVKYPLLCAGSLQVPFSVQCQAAMRSSVLLR